MSEKQREALQQLSDRFSKLTAEWEDYWKSYSSWDTWPFWVLLALLVLPLIALIFLMDRKRAFQIGFYGFAIHSISIYIDLYATTHRMWAYPYKVFSFPPSSFSLDAALIPVAYMLLYQWTPRKWWHYYASLLALAAVFAFGLKPLLSKVGLFQLQESSYWTLFLLYFGGGVIGKWIADLFGYAQRTASRA